MRSIKRTPTYPRKGRQTGSTVRAILCSDAGYTFRCIVWLPLRLISGSNGWLGWLGNKPPMRLRLNDPSLVSSLPPPQSFSRLPVLLAVFLLGCSLGSLLLELAQAALERSISIRLTEVILLKFRTHPIRSLLSTLLFNIITPP